MFFIRVALGLPRSLFPSILPSSNNFWIDLALITCPKYGHFLFFIVGNNELVVFAIFKNSSLVLLSVHDTIKIVRFPPAYDLTRSAAPSELCTLLPERLEQATKYIERNVHKHTQKTRLFVSNTKFLTETAL